jgi:hypothetical protein
MKEKAKRPARELVLYEETYVRGSMMIRESCLPNLSHVDGGRFMVHSGELLKAGRVECPDGVQREFQVIRFLLTERRAASSEGQP